MLWRDFISRYCNYILISLVTLTLLYQNSSLEKKIRREFYSLTVLSFLIVLLDILSECNLASGGTVLLCTAVSHVTYALKPALLYGVLLISERSRSLRYRHLEALPLLLLTVVLAVGFPFRWVAWYGPETATFQTGPLIPLTWITLLIYLVLILRSAFAEKCSRTERVSLIMGEAFITINIINERFVHIPLPGMENTVTALAILIYCLCFCSHSEREQRLLHEQELDRARTQAMISQIQPHFIYNTLACIAEICHEGSPQGEDAILSFSAYLRGCFQSLTDDGLIPFSNELKTIRHYVKLEQIQDPQKIRVQFDIQETDFRVPVLSVQTLVENAIKHGIRKKHGGGTVIIRTLRDERGIVISIIDDGAGFDTSARLPAEGHLGLRNAKMRLYQQCGAEMQITSRSGLGTQIQIILKEEMQQ